MCSLLCTLRSKQSLLKKKPTHQTKKTLLHMVDLNTSKTDEATRTQLNTLMPLSDQ